jgi:hypothetical protein
VEQEALSWGYLPRAVATTLAINIVIVARFTCMGIGAPPIRSLLAVEILLAGFVVAGAFLALLVSNIVYSLVSRQC